MEIHYFDNAQKVDKAYKRALEPFCKQWSLTKNEVDILLFLYNNPEFHKATDIVRFRGLVKSHVSLSIGTLEEKGLLSKSPEDKDRRSISLSLTQRGRQLAAQAQFLQREFFDRLYRNISAEEMAVWKSIVLKFEKNIQNL